MTLYISEVAPCDSLWPLERGQDLRTFDPLCPISSAAPGSAPQGGSLTKVNPRCSLHCQLGCVWESHLLRIVAGIEDKDGSVCHRQICWARPGCDITHLIPSITFWAVEPNYSLIPAGGLQSHLSQVCIVGRDSKHETKSSKLEIHLLCSLSSLAIKKQINQKP